MKYYSPLPDHSSLHSLHILQSIFGGLPFCTFGIHSKTEDKGNRKGPSICNSGYSYNTNDDDDDDDHHHHHLLRLHICIAERYGRRPPYHVSNEEAHRSVRSSSSYLGGQVLGVVVVRAVLALSIFPLRIQSALTNRGTSSFQSTLLSVPPLLPSRSTSPCSCSAAIFFTNIHKLFFIPEV